MLTCCADIHVRHEEVDEQQIFIDLPFHLRAEVAANLTKNLLKHSHVRRLLLPFKCEQGNAYHAQSI